MVQVSNQFETLRLRFKKTGNLQYISHLDLVRTMGKIIVRAQFPLWYTEGFNPKPKMVFAAPLSVGAESICEYMDLRLTERMDPAEALKRINANMTGEMQATEAYYATSKLSDLAFLSYEITLHTENADAALAEKIRNTLLGDSLTVIKKTKSGDAEVDIRPLIHSATVAFDESSRDIRICCILSGDQTRFLNPELMLKALRNTCGILSSENLLSEWTKILRTEAFFADMSVFR